MGADGAGAQEADRLVDCSTIGQSYERAHAGGAHQQEAIVVGARQSQHLLVQADILFTNDPAHRQHRLDDRLQGGRVLNQLEDARFIASPRTMPTLRPKLRSRPRMLFWTSSSLPEGSVGHSAAL